MQYLKNYLNKIIARGNKKTRRIYFQNRRRYWKELYQHFFIYKSRDWASLWQCSVRQNWSDVWNIM